MGELAEREWHTAAAQAMQNMADLLVSTGILTYGEYVAVVATAVEYDVALKEAHDGQVD